MNRDNINLNVYREPDPATIQKLSTAARTWRAATEAANDARANLDYEIIQAWKSGHSFAQIRETVSIGTGTIQAVLAKAGLIDYNYGQKK